MLEQITSEGPERCLKCGLVLASRDPAVPPSRDNCRGPDSRGCLRRQLAAEKRGREIAERTMELLFMQMRDMPYREEWWTIRERVPANKRAIRFAEFCRHKAQEEWEAEHGGEKDHHV